MDESVRKGNTGGNFQEQFGQIDARQHACNLGAQRDQRRRLFHFVQRAEYQFQLVAHLIKPHDRVLEQPGGQRTENVRTRELPFSVIEQASTRIGVTPAQRHEHIALAKQRGAYRGRKKALGLDQVVELRRRAGDGESKAALAREFGISRETLYPLLENGCHMKIHAPVDGLSDAERLMLVDGLRALRKKRGKAWNEAYDAADAAGRRRPALRQFGIHHILRLAERLGGSIAHRARWTGQRLTPVFRSTAPQTLTSLYTALLM